MQTSRLITYSVALTGIFAGCRDVTAPPFDGTIELTPDVAMAASKSIGPEGGTITAQGSNGTTFTLTVPEGAIPGDLTRTITVTPISSFGGMPLKRAMGVQLSPSGLSFLVPARLTITRPAGSANRNIVGFGSRDDGTEFFIRPASTEGSAVTFAVSHFSAAGAGEAEDLQALLNLAGGSGSGMMVQLGLATLSYMANNIDDNGFIAAILGALREEYTDVVKVRLEVASEPDNLDNDQVSYGALTPYAAWSFFVKTELPKFADIPPAILTAVQQGIAPEIKQADSLAAGLLRGRISRANDRCKTQRSLDHASAVLRWRDLAKSYGLATAANGLDDVSITLGLCVRVAYQSVTFPQTLTQGQVAQLRFVAGLVYEGGGPTYTPPLSVQVTPTGTTQLSPSVGLTNASGEYTDGFTPAQPGAQVVLGLHTCVDASQYARLAGVCADQQVTRGVKPVEISLTPTTSTLNPGKTAQFTATVTGASNTSVTWSATGGTISSGGLYTAGSAVGDFEVVARSVADTSKKAMAKISIVPVSTPAQSFAGTYKGTGTWIKKSFNAGTQSYEDKQFSGMLEVQVTQISGNEHGVVIKVFNEPTVPAAYDYYAFGGTIGANGTGTAAQTRECFYSGTGAFSPNWPGLPVSGCSVLHHNFTLTISIANSQASGSFGAKELGDPGVFTFTNLPKQ